MILLMRSGIFWAETTVLHMLTGTVILNKRRPVKRLRTVSSQMRILTVADVPSRFYYDFYSPGKLDDFDLILAAGDLGRDYLEFLVTMARCPLVYVRGNHDDGLLAHPPEGCICAEDRVIDCAGLRILGLGGSHRYREGENLFTEAQMRRRVRQVQPRVRRRGGIDILLTHAPARGLNDFDSLSHRGFECFLTLLDAWRPKYFVHGHIHKNYGMNIPQRSSYGDTTVINACEHCIIED